MVKPKIKSQWKEENQEFVTSDPRFSKVFSDPRFMRPKKKNTKLNIDNRFTKMLQNDEFSVVGKVDKYGRKIKNNKSDLKRFYKIEDEDSDKEDKGEDNEEEENDKEEESSDESEVEKEGEEDEEEEDDDEIKFDPARGEGVMYSSSEDEWSDEDEIDDYTAGPDVDIFGEVPVGDQTKRFAVVNLDWDKIRATDLYKLFDSFKPANGSIKYVKIYKSEFGKERLEKESKEGPPAEIFGGKLEDEEEEITAENIVKEDNGEEFDNEKLRKYQLERLRYYYAVVECDTVDTAAYLYKNCDGIEIEKSSNILDIRFIPDEEKFEEEPVNEAHEAPVVYEPTDFTTEALQHSKVKLTWDDDDPDRLKVTRRKFTKDDLKSMDFQAYLASDDEEEEEDPEEARKKYMNLLLGDNEEDEDKNEEMEITFAPGLSQVAQSILDKKKEKEEMKNETVFDTYLRKQREKKKAKRDMKKKLNKDDNDDDNLISDHENIEDEIDINDPFFAEAEKELEESQEYQKEITKEKSKKSKKIRKSREERENARKNKEELQLLMDDNGDRLNKMNEFNMKDVLKREKLQGKKKLKGKQKRLQAELAEDNFELDVKDPRFSSVLTDHQFAIDPTMPQYKKTKNMKKLMEARQHKSKSTSANETISNNDTAEVDKKEISSMINSIKRKALAMNNNDTVKRSKKN